MSDADDQMGGSGGETGSPPDKVKPGTDNAAPAGTPPPPDAPGEDPAGQGSG